MEFKKPKSEKPNKVTKAVPFDIDAINRCQSYAKHHGISFSAVVRIAVGDFFINIEEKK